MYTSANIRRRHGIKIRIKELRKAAGFKSRKELAVALGGSYTVRQLASWETGERMLSLEQARDIADLLHCTLDELAGRDFSPAEYSDPRQGRLNHAWSALNDVGREEAEKRVSELTEIASYTLDKGVALQAKEA